MLKRQSIRCQAVKIISPSCTQERDGKNGTAGMS
jgi:hypothetical protein